MINPDARKNEGIDPPYNWVKRRRFMYLVSTFCAAVISYVLWKGMVGPVAETAVTFAFLCLGGIVGSYVFGAAWDDKNKMTLTKEDR